MRATADGAGAGFGSALEALRSGRAMVDYLSAPAARGLDGPACGEALVAIGAIASGLAAVRDGLLRRFDADSGHDADGYASTAAWLAARTGLGRKDAKAAVRRMRLLARHPLLGDAAAAGTVTTSRAREMAGWTGRIKDEELQAGADRILLDGAGRLTGDLTPECAAAVTAVLEALGKKRGPEDGRTAAQRFHDALQEG